MIRKIFSIVFSALVLFNLFGYYFVFICNQIEVKSEMKGKIMDGSLTARYEEITILNPATNPDFKVLEKGEIQYCGKLYDVISSTVSGNSVVFRCINDTKEELILVRYNNYSSQVAGLNLPERSKTSQAMLFHIIKHALLDRYTIQPPDASSEFLFTQQISDFHSITINPDFPPPRLI
jgi:hypothetical protein